MSFRLQPDPPAEVPVIRRISVTAFKSYLTCPFRFYLRNVLAMEERDDSKTELDAMDFGNLVHYALQRMGEDQEVEDWHDEKTLAEFLWAEAGQWANSRFGAHPPLQVAMQLDAARQRLAAAARQHVGLLREGWRTIARESRVTTELNGMTISGIIDRVDRHEQSGRIRIIDYKTSDTPVTPMKAHLARAEEGTPDFACVTVDGKSMKWCDLQLPLYCRLLAPVMDLPDELEVGYFNLPKAIGDTGLSLWGDFSATLQSSAEACAAGVISAVQAGRFWPPADRVVYDDFESILLGDPNAAVAWQAGSDS